jgi:hypothetical protein
MSSKSGQEGLGWFIALAFFAMIAYAIYQGLDSFAWVPHRVDTVVTAQANWFVGESKNCSSYPLDSQTARSLKEPKGYGVARIGCDDGPEHSVKVTFYGKLEQPEHRWLSWRCTRNQDSFTCKQTGDSAEITTDKVAGRYSGNVQNETARLSANFDTVLDEEPGLLLSGCMSVHRPLYGSGKITGEFRSSEITFQVSSSVGLIRFTGMRAGNDIHGRYSVIRAGETQYGEFDLHRQSELPADFNPTVCPDDSEVH